MPKTRRAGRKHHRRRHSRHRRGLAGKVAGLGARSFGDIAEGSGVIVGEVPIVGTYGKRGLDMVGHTGRDFMNLAGRTGDRAAGFLTSPFNRLFGRKRRRHARHARRTRHKHGHRRRHAKHRRTKHHRRHRRR